MQMKETGMLNANKKTLILFDVDGTLVYSERRDSRSFARAYQKVFGKEFPTIDWNRFEHVTDTSIFGSAFRGQFQREVTEEEMERFMQVYLARLRESRKKDPTHFKEVPAARTVIDQLQADGFQVAIATGGWGRPARLKLEHVEIEVNGMVLSSADGHHTREEIIQTALKRQGICEDTRVVYIGDAPWDVSTTRGLGMDFIGVRWRGDFEKLHSLGASVVVKDYSDYGGFLEAIQKAAPPGKKNPEK
jgi:phosphoglycolate phosphatase-like HAD superfamily hydrolase